MRVKPLARFALVGLAGTLMYVVLLGLLVEALHWPVMAATCCAFLLVVAENYWLHRCWSFRSAAPHRQALPSFLLVSATGFCVNAAVMALGVEHYQVNYLAVQALAIVLVVACNFIGASRIFQPSPPSLT